MPADTPPHRIFKDVSDPMWLWLNTAGRRQSPIVARALPGAPDEQTQARFTGAAGDATFEDGMRNYRLFKRVYETHAGRLPENARILDFGCGWGRIIRFFLRDVDPAGLWGIDCFERMIEICRQTNRWCNFRAIAPLPPTDLPDDAFDLIYLFSVFSHLSEDAHQQWLTEFRRLLKPGGLLIATTRPRSFIERLAAWREQGSVPQYVPGQAFPDAPQALADYDRGRFCHAATGGGDVLKNSFYGETCIPRQYVLDRWTDRYEFLDFIGAGSVLQNAIVVRKPA